MSENKRLYLVTGAAGILVKHQIYEMAEYEEDKFFKHLYRESKLPRDDYNRSGMAYVMSKNFTVWYAQKSSQMKGTDISAASMS